MALGISYLTGNCLAVTSDHWRCEVVLSVICKNECNCSPNGLEIYKPSQLELYLVPKVLQNSI